MVIAGDELKTPSYSPAVSGLANKNHRSRHAWRSRQPNITINTILAVVTAQQGAVLTTVAAQQGTVLTTVDAQQETIPSTVPAQQAAALPTVVEQ